MSKHNLEAKLINKFHVLEKPVEKNSKKIDKEIIIDCLKSILDEGNGAELSNSDFKSMLSVFKIPEKEIFEDPSKMKCALM